MQVAPPGPSHVKCWDWLLAAPSHTHALVLEDDACVESHFTATLNDIILPLLEVPDQWDCLFIGYFRPTAEESGVIITTPRGPVRLRVITQFFGTHGYIVSRNAATILRRHVYPMDQQSDAIFMTLRDLGLLRVYCLPTPIVTQCMDNVDRQGSWHTHRLVTGNDSTVTDRPWLTFLHYVLIALVSITATVVAMNAYHRRRPDGGT